MSRGLSCSGVHPFASIFVRSACCRFIASSTLYTRELNPWNFCPGFIFGAVFIFVTMTFVEYLTMNIATAPSIPRVTSENICGSI